MWKKHIFCKFYENDKLILEKNLVSIPMIGERVSLDEVDYHILNRHWFIYSDQTSSSCKYSIVKI